MREPKPSFTRGIYAGAIHDSLLFPYPPPLERRDAGEAGVVERLIREIRALAGDVIDSARIDEEETVGEPVIRALGTLGALGLTVPKSYGGMGLSATGYARVFGAIS